MDKKENHEYVSQGFRLLLGALTPYIVCEFEAEYGEDWWNKAILETLYDEQKRDLPTSGEKEKLINSLDIQRCLILFDVHWNDIFRKKLSVDHRTWAKELVGVRNKAAHLGNTDFSEDDTWRALDTMSRLCDQLNAENAEEIRSLLRILRYGTTNGSTSVAESKMVSNSSKNSKTSGVLLQTPMAGLSGWREIIEPHPDVAQGRYKNAEFAADLAQVARGEGAYEYRDPVEFFARTYVTEGMAGLLEQSLRRVTGQDGDPIVQLKTAFGGGKTHSMLALYHMMRGRVSAEKVPNIQRVLEAAEVKTIPKVNVAVLVGTALDPTRSRRPQNFSGITINTLWGEMAAQLAESAGNPKLYDYVKEADKKGVSPGSETLKNLFDACGPCLVLMDELVSYAKRIYGVKDLPAGSFDNFISFIQEITEAARASKNSLVVASIPESDIEIGGEAGQKALETIEHTFGRMESIWKPVAANEGFEVVRRRLFLDCKDPDKRELVCREFSRMYVENQADFPIETKELEYKERLVSCYPIHPEIFDRLYEDWATLERFQRTRGVLRLMAAVIHELWMSNDAGLMIMPGSIPMDAPNVRDELTRHLPEGWNALVDREVDGKKSIPYQKDQESVRYGKGLASRRVARTIMLGSAPTVRDQANRGIETARIRLGIVQPGETIANFNDALNTLQNSLAYLYTSGNRFWYDTRPTLRKTADDRASTIKDLDVEYEIENRLKKLRKASHFDGVHICPTSSLDVTDDQNVRLVVLAPSAGYKAALENSPANSEIENILNNRGNSPRIYRNMLAFVAPDKDLMIPLKDEVRRYLAWNSIKEDRETLNLDVAQNRETENNLRRSNETVELRLKETYCWLILPYIDREKDIKTIIWDATRISGGNDDIIPKAAQKMKQNEALITEWAPALLLMELDSVLWRESNAISIKKLWEYLCSYCYLPRLANYNVLEKTIRTGLNSPEYFAYAAAIKEDKFIDLKYNQYVGTIDSSGYLVKKEDAQKQIDEIAKSQPTSDTPNYASPLVRETPNTYSANPNSIGSADVTQKELPSKKTRFFMSAKLDNTRINRDVQRLVEEIISHLTAEGAKTDVVLEVDAVISEGISPQTVRIISENCRTLKIENFGFEDSK